MPLVQMPVGGATVCGLGHYINIQERTSLNMCSAQCKDHRQRQHRTKHKGHTPSPRIEIKIHNPAGNRTRATGLEGRGSTDHATATDFMVSYKNK